MGQYNTSRSSISLLFLLVSAAAVSCSIPDHVHDYIKNVLLSFEGQSVMSFVINPPSPNVSDRQLKATDFLLPTLIIWNPYAMYPLMFPPDSIICPTCKQPTKKSHWKDGSTSSTQPRCENKHSLLAHDEVILRCFPSPTIIPFILLKRTGVTTSLADMCTSMIVKGMNFQAIESLIVERRMATYARTCDFIRQHEQLCGALLLARLPEFWSTELSQSPSDFVLKQCFVTMFLRNEKLYIRELNALPVGSSISFDPTFKIGDNGKIVTWQLTRGTSFAEIEMLLQNLKQRCHSIMTVYIDDCCKLRNKLQEVLGSDAIIKLDLFHAVQRISRTLTKKCGLHQNCLRDLTMVFRANGDVGKTRQCPTPQSERMLTKLDVFLEKWVILKDMNGISVFGGDTVHAIENLKKHIREGCLSNIPPGAGTNRNERFHHHVNALLHTSKLGILLAYALLTVVVHSYNSSHHRKSRIISDPIVCSKFRHDSTTIPLTPVGILPKERLLGVESNTDLEIDISACVIDLEKVRGILEISYQKLQIFRCVTQMGSVPLSNYVKHFKLHSSVSNVSHDCSKQVVIDHLQANGLQFTAILGDGNCFFSAIAANITNSPNGWKPVLNRLKIDETGVHVDVLRKAMVGELLGHRRPEYEDFLSTLVPNYEEAVKCFLEPSFFNSPIGDAMPLAMARALQCSIVIFSSDIAQPPTYVSPVNIECSAIAFLVYNTSGLGHYDAALPVAVHQQATETPNTKAMSCRCGSNKKTVNRSSSCSDNPFYSSRCKCLKHGQPCTSLCQCYECCNPHGERPHKLSKTVQCRLNRRHHLQTKVPKSRLFAEQRGGKIAKGNWSDLETILLHEVLSTSMVNVKDTYYQTIQRSTRILSSRVLRNTTTF